MILFTLTGRGLFSGHAPDFTPDNVEENIRKWADNAGLGTAKMPEAPNVYFGVILTLNSGNQLTVYRGKEKSGFLQLQSPLVLSPEHLQILSSLTKNKPMTRWGK